MKDFMWNERFAWYHFNYKEVYHYTQADFEREAEAYAQQGITTIITFGGTHFILTFEPYWEDIFACIGRLVRAFHKYGIKVVEHRSYSLAARNAPQEHWASSANMRDFPNWPGLKERIFTDYTIRDVPVSTMSQVDGRTGQPQICGYDAHCLCPNNPDYMAISEYIAGRIMAQGVDGMMNDDIQYHQNACACEHCRRKFKEETGFTLPSPEGWADFYENYDDPAYIAWKQFKVRSTARYLERIVAVERSRGLKMLRPAYTAIILDGNWSSMSLEEGLPHYMNYFQENCRPIVDRYCFQNYMMEATDRYARAQRMGIPSMSLFYPYTPALTYFSWALAHTWGQMYTGTVHDADITRTERPYREFEQAHQAFMGASQKCADLAIYQSVLTRECRPYGAAFPTMSLIMASNFSGLMTDMVYEEDSLETLLPYPQIVVNCAEMLADEHIAKLRAYAEAGGKLLLIGLCGAYDQSLMRRTPQAIAKALGILTPVISCEEKKTGVFSYNGICVAFDDMRTTCCFDASDGVLKADDTVLGIREPVGKGEIMWLLPQLDGAPLDNVPFDRTPCIEFCDYDKPHPEVPPSVIPKLRATTGAMLRAIVGKPNITAKCQSSDLLVSAFRVKPGYVVHIANISHTFSTEYRRVWHEDPLLGFDGGYRIPDPIEISLAYEGGRLPTITLFSTELEDGIALEGKLADGRLLFTIPGDIFGGYGMVEIS